MREFERQRGHDHAIRASSPAKPQPCTCRGHYQPPEPDLHRLLLLLRAKKNYLINWMVAGSGAELIFVLCHSIRRQTHHILYINKHCYRIRIRILDIVTVNIHVIQNALQGLRDAVQALARF